MSEILPIGFKRNVKNDREALFQILAIGVIVAAIETKPNQGIEILNYHKQEKYQNLFKKKELKKETLKNNWFMGPFYVYDFNKK